ncbi:hypothetical protein N7530_003787 [Penicillium desertorum]|uniref:Uncharacterized protein n=1 Tax=Penicillium desertorum TaxID=1303715 RepID=A0A9W9WX02_9EURO|nr:hypothetical protein N7530_003787 [Penicillium desertorum]
MDKTLPDTEAITVPVPTAELAPEYRYSAFPVTDISHFVVQLDSIMQSIAGIPYDSNMPWPFWFLIGKIVSKAFFSDEGRLEWLNAVRVRTREFIAFTNIQSNRVSNQDKTDIEEAKLQVVEVDFSRPQPGEVLNLFWKPARPIISKKVQDWLDYSSTRAAEDNPRC